MARLAPVLGGDVDRDAVQPGRRLERPSNSASLRCTTKNTSCSASGKSRSATPRARSTRRTRARCCSTSCVTSRRVVALGGRWRVPACVSGRLGRGGCCMSLPSWSEPAAIPNALGTRIQRLRENTRPAATLQIERGLRGRQSQDHPRQPARERANSCTRTSKHTRSSSASSLCAITVAGPITAVRAEPPPHDAAREDPTTYTFDDDTVLGDTVGAMGEVLTVRQRGAARVADPSRASISSASCSSRSRRCDASGVVAARRLCAGLRAARVRVGARPCTISSCVDPERKCALVRFSGCAALLAES